MFRTGIILFSFWLISLASCTPQQSAEVERIATSNGKDSLIVLHIESNSPYEIGYQHGEALRKEIHLMVDLWKNDMEAAFEIPADSFITHFLRSTNFQTSIAKHTPHLLEEIRGISDGANIPFETMYAYQLIDELWTNGNTISENYHHCTSMGVMNSVNGQTGSLIAQNIDVPSFYHTFKVLIHLTGKADQHEQYISTFPGYIGANGLNQHIGINVNSLLDIQNSLDGLPVCCVVRGTLQHQTFDDAVTFIHSVQHASGQNYIIGSADSIVSLECSAIQITPFWPTASKHITYHANNSLANDTYRKLYTNYLADHLHLTHEEYVAQGKRFQSMEQRFSNTTTVTVSKVKEALQSEDNFIDPICNANTWVSTIMEFKHDSSVLHFSPGSPDEVDYIQFVLK
jgi:hypothetical protein